MEEPCHNHGIAQVCTSMSKNERKTENIVRDVLREHGYFDGSNDIVIEEQKSNIDEVRKLLKAASKSGGGGIGSPEFIVSSPSNADFLLVIECKASTKDHISPVCVRALDSETIAESQAEYSKRAQRFATDGVLHYAAQLA